MDFSEPFACGCNPGPAFSPDGRFVATAVEYRLLIRETQSMRVVQLYICLDRIDALSWCPNSLYVCAGLFARGLLQIWSVEQPEWTCKIDEGPAGIKAVQWTPDGLGLVIVADFNIRTTIWSLLSRTCTYLQGPKATVGALLFSPDGSRLAVLERRECKDVMSLYDARTWSPLNSFTLATTDATGAAWSPDSHAVVVWDTCLSYGLAIYSTEGALLGSFSAYNDALGVKAVAWAPSGQLLAVGSFDQAARILNHVTWQPLLVCEHPTTVSGPTNVVVYREVEASSSGGHAGSAGAEDKSAYVICELPAQITSHKPAPGKANPKLGVGIVTWSADGSYLATRNDNMSESVWVWDVAAMELAAVLVHAAPIQVLRWAPQGGTLAAVTGCGKVFLWTPAGASIVHIPVPNFKACGVEWSCRSDALLLTDTDAGAFCCAYSMGPD